MDMDTDVTKKEPTFYESVHVTPLVEIFNISVNGNVNKPFGVYGEINVTDRDRTFLIYNRTIGNQQLMVSGNKLLLTVKDDLDNAVIIPSKDASLKVKLFVISGHDKITLDGSITLGRTCTVEWSDEYEDKKTIARNNNWTVKVQYAIFPYAVTATVRLMHFSKDDDFDSGVVASVGGDDYESGDEVDVTEYERNSCSDITKLYGSVFACAAVSGNNGQRSSLFSKTVQDCVQVQSGRFINLSRSVVAVPAYSSLQIKATFFDGDNGSLIADDTVEFKPVYNWEPYKKDIVRGNGRIRVQVLWRGAYDQLYGNNPIDEWDPTTLDSWDDDSFKKQRVMSGQQVVSKRPSSATLNDDCSLPEHNSSATLNDDCSLPEHNSSETYSSNWVLPSSTYTEPLLELFSVVVCSKDSKPFMFYGSICFANCYCPKHVFWDESCPVECPTSGMSVILEGFPQDKSWSLIQDFALIVDIKDAISKAAISRGVIAFHRLNLELLADRRLCSVIRGKQGFAAVHYSIFSEGVSAIVNIKPSDKCPLGIIIKGEIYALYGNIEPGRCYQDKFYKNLVFYNEDGVQLNDSKHTLPLLKSLLSLPIESILIIEANLLVSTVDGSLAEGPKPLKGNIKFSNNRDSPQQLCNGNLCLDVSVRFSSRRLAKR